MTKVKTKLFGVSSIYTLFIIIATMMFLSIFSSLALFQRTLEKTGVVALVANDVNQVLSSSESDFTISSDKTYGTITVAASTSKFFDITITNEKSANLKYKLYYAFTSGTTVSGVEVGISDQSTNTESGILTASGVDGSTKTIRVGIVNSSTSSVSIDIGSQGGYVANDITLDSGRNEMSSIMESDYVTVALANLSLVDEISTTSDEILPFASKTTISIAKESESEADFYAKIDLADIEISDSYKSYDVKWALYQGETKVTTGSFAQTIDGNTSINMANNILISSTTAIEYTLYIWIPNTTSDQTTLSTGNLNAKLKVIKRDEKQTTLASKILGEDNANVLTASPIFTSSSTDLGLYEQYDDTTKSNYGFSTYYYRGSVTNNYVQLGTYKSDITNYVYNDSTKAYAETKVASASDPILWRIVRINEDGSIKLIAENNIGVNSTWNLSESNNKYVNDDGSYSNIKKELENFYTTHLSIDTNVSSKIQSNTFISDRRVDNDAAYDRLQVDLNPTFTVPTDAIVDVSKIGSITADELMYSGSLAANSVASTTYLDNLTSFWTITPSDASDTYYWNTKNKYFMYTLGTDNTIAGIRPVINIKADAIVSDGTGSSSNPYVIKVD